jgi:hypothetical protein
MMKKSLIAVGFVVVTVFFSVSQAQFLGQLSTAQSPGPGNSVAGGYFGIYENAFSFFGQFRYGFANYLDGAVKVGFINIDAGPDDQAGLLLGGDLKYQLLDAALGDPFDLAVGGMTEFAVVSDFNTFSLGGSVIGSYPFEMRTGRHISPYGRFNMRMQRVSNGVSDTDLEIEVDLGTQVELSSDWSLIGEFIIWDDIGFLLGFNYKF